MVKYRQGNTASKGDFYIVQALIGYADSRVNLKKVSWAQGVKFEKLVMYFWAELTSYSYKTMHLHFLN